MQKLKKLKCLALVFVLTAGVQSAVAAVPQRDTGAKSSDFMKLLNAPLSEAARAIYGHGPEGYQALRRMSFEEAYPMATRWKAFMVMVRIGGKKSFPEIRQALLSRDWFMRSAGLQALANVDKKRAAKAARKLFRSDKAMMVRAKAVDVLRASPSRKVRKMLWSRLYAKENYYRNQGLWIRKHIVQYLVDHGKKSDLKGFLKIFNSKKLEDSELKALAFPALERLMRKAPSASLSTPAKVAFWHSELKTKVR